ncbi:MAG: c-type cytochrome biogenesis protein CcmI [Pelagimonas sp.]|jgi:cytochrome c-type biogenesis protein CcmH|nr:c-type cytochrome biogenesis protein CcmI [Pelagimonas sp.]
MTFWILSGALALILTLALLSALLRGRRDTGPAAAFDLKVYRDQLDEVAQDAARGKIPPEEAERIRTEISRRILAADAKAQESQTVGAAPRTLSWITGGLVALTVVGGGFGLYVSMGAPGYGDLPLQMRLDTAQAALRNRPSQSEAEANVPASVAPEASAEYQELVTRLRSAVAERPDDIQGHVLLARSEAALGNYVAAYQAQARIIQLRGDEVQVSDLTDLADMMVIAAGGYVSPEAQSVLDRVISEDPKNGVARFYGGLLMAQTGRPDLGFRIWDDLLKDSDPNAPWVSPVMRQIEEMAFRAGVSDYKVPELSAPSEAAPGPSAEDVANAAEMTPEERMDMVRGMVGQLSDRLATEGGTPEEWARLLSSLAVLGEMDRAGAIWTEAKTVFAEQPQALEILSATARRIGLE